MRYTILALCMLAACGTSVRPKPQPQPNVWAPGEPFPGECNPSARQSAENGCPTGTSPVWEDQECRYVSTNVAEPLWIDAGGWQWRIDTITGDAKPFNGGKIPFADLIFPFYPDQVSCEAQAIIGADLSIPDYDLVPGNVYAIYGGQTHFALRKDAVRGARTPSHVWRWTGSGCAQMAPPPGMAWYHGGDFVPTNIANVPMFAGPLALVCRPGL